MGINSHKTKSTNFRRPIMVIKRNFFQGIQTPAEPNTGSIPLNTIVSGDSEKIDSGNFDDEEHKSEHNHEALKVNRSLLCDVGVFTR